MDHLVNEWPTSRTSLYLSAIRHRLSTISDTEPILSSSSSFNDNPFYQLHSPPIKSTIENNNTLEDHQKKHIANNASTSIRASRSPLLRLDVSITNDSTIQLDQCDVKPLQQHSFNELRENSLSTFVPQGFQRCDQTEQHGIQRFANLRNKRHSQGIQLNKSNHYLSSSSSPSSLVQRWNFNRLKGDEPIEAIDMRKVIDEPFVSTLQYDDLNNVRNGCDGDELSLSLSLSSVNSNCNHVTILTNK